MDAADALDGQRRDVIDVPLHDPLEPIAQSQDVHPLQLRRPGERGGIARLEHVELVALRRQRGL